MKMMLMKKKKILKQNLKKESQIDKELRQIKDDIMTTKKVYTRGLHSANSMDPFIGEFEGALVFVPMQGEKVAIFEILVSGSKADRLDNGKQKGSTEKDN